MNYQESLDFLYGLQTFGIKLGLENIRAFLSRLGHPESRFKTILVAGTNGKGSTASALAAILTRSGYRTGLYTSPHLHSFGERIRIDGYSAPDERVAELVEELRPLAGELPMTFFEFTTALAIRYFADHAAQFAVLEVGLGGRLDATNAVKPSISLITPISADHQQHLGAELPQIAREKAGIMRTGVPVISASQEPAVEEVLRHEAAKRGTTIRFCGDEFDYEERDQAFDYIGHSLRIDELHPGVEGRHQFVNMTVALAAAEELVRGGFDISPEAMRSGVENVHWPGRLEWMAGRTILLDGAHNGAGAKSLAAYLQERQVADVHWIVGMKADKNSEEILRPLIPHAARLYCVEPPVEEALARTDLLAAASRAGLPAEACVTIDEALHKARQGAGRDGIVLVAGSLFLVAAVRELILEEDSPCDASGC